MTNSILDGKHEGSLPGAIGLTIASDASWIVGADGRQRSLRGRPVLRRVLSALAQTRAGAAEPLSVRELFERGWPNECVPAPHLHNRVYVTIHSLRALGLGAALACEGGRYSLRGEVHVVDGISQEHR